MKHKIHMSLILFALLAAALLSSCQSSSSKGIVTGQYYDPNQAAESTKDTKEIQNTNSVSDTEEAANAQEDTGITSDLFLIISNDMQSEKLMLMQLASGKQYMYNYLITTRFLDKYGNRATVSDFEPGRCITVEKKDTQGRLLEAKISDVTWEYPGVTRYSVDEERGIFQIADTKYSYDENVFVNSDGETIQFSDLTEMDTLRITGVGKKILAVSVTTGHGELQLENTDLFEGSYIQIGSKIFSQITKDMLLEIPEGTYTVTVANNGYGGSTEVTIERGQKEVLDLDTLKGEGPKMGNILFAVNVAGAIVQIDGKAVDYSEPVSIQYGVHTLTVTADNYETYSKKLFVNTEEATIVIGLTEESSSTDTADSGDSDDSEEDDEITSSEGTTESSTGTASTSTAAGSTSAGSKAGSLAGSQAGSLAGSSSTGTGSGTTSGSSTSTGSSSTNESVTDAAISAILDSISSDDDDTTDYLSTLSEVLSVLTGN